MTQEKRIFVYSGPVLQFDRVVADRWQGTTCAVSVQQARSNLTYQFKRQFGLAPSSRVSLGKQPTAMGQ